MNHSELFCGFSNKLETLTRRRKLRCLGQKLHISALFHDNAKFFLQNETTSLITSPSLYEDSYSVCSNCIKRREKNTYTMLNCMYACYTVNKYFLKRNFFFVVKIESECSGIIKAIDVLTEHSINIFRTFLTLIFELLRIFVKPSYIIYTICAISHRHVKSRLLSQSFLPHDLSLNENLLNVCICTWFFCT